jgi:CDGSH-type Zn-finger protein
MENQKLKITVLPNGPLMVEGKISVEKPDGICDEHEAKAFLCRCGHSTKKPYCDGNHKKNNFEG